MGATPSSEQEPLDTEPPALAQQANEKAASNMRVESIPEKLASMPRTEQLQSQANSRDLRGVLNITEPPEIK
jgi:hypothetical protein